MFLFDDYIHFYIQKQQMYLGYHSLRGFDLANSTMDIVLLLPM
jgi:hypothetical protein